MTDASGGADASSGKFSIKFYYTQDFANDFKSTKKTDQFFKKVVNNLNKSFRNSNITLEAVLQNTEVRTVAPDKQSSISTLQLFRGSANLEDILDGSSAAVLFVDDFKPKNKRWI